MKKLKLSIALVAYNREQFLREQLRSIIAQSRLPDELIIGDDCSTDRTADVISEFAAQAPFPVRRYINERNEGYSRNLEFGLQLCSGDVIVLCDDDDICLPPRLKMIETEFQRSAVTGLMLSNSALVDDELEPLGITLWDTVRFSGQQTGRILYNPISTLAKHFIAAGHVMAFRGSMRRYILPFPQRLPQGVFCDVWIALVLASVTRVVCVPESLVVHRLHAEQIAGVRTLVSSNERRKNRSEERRRIAEFVELIEEVIGHVSSLADTPFAEGNLKSLNRWAGHMKMQARLSEAKHRRLCLIAHAFLRGQYHRYSRGLLTAARDLLLLH